MCECGDQRVLYSSVPGISSSSLVLGYILWFGRKFLGFQFFKLDWTLNIKLLTIHGIFWMLVASLKMWFAFPLIWSTVKAKEVENCQRKKLKGCSVELEERAHILLASLHLAPCTRPPWTALHLNFICSTRRAPTPDHSPVCLLSGALLTLPSVISTSQQSLWFYLFEFWQKWNHLPHFVETSLILFQSWQECTTTTSQRW